MQKFSYHTHTTFSDGKNSVKEMIEQAVSLGWKELGISDHLIVHKNIPNSPSWYKWQKEPEIFHWSFNDIYEKFARHIEEIHKTSENYPISVRVGAEVDFFTYDGWLDEFLRLREKLAFDYFISGNHYLFLDDAGENIIDFKDAQNLPIEQQSTMVKRHFKTIEKAVASDLFSFIAHIDYVRKLPLCESDKKKKKKMQLIKTIAKNNATTEISTKGIRKGGDFYPDCNLVKAAIENGVRFVISDDAHRTDELGYHFDYAEDVLSRFNCNSRWHFVNK